ncbi:hypothetical protein ACFVGM_08670 [Kitasatospora purpeofusca]|uniref:hypothetical protein n=1 Tax=Kitasatospora purpeofusca TaxID=67352 RepID=UPI0036CF7EB9
MNANLSYAPPYNLAQPGSVTYGGGGGNNLLHGARSILDARRMMATGRVPSAEYPDGYLGTIGAGTRRQDRLLNNIGTRETQRSYQRGVHKGERIDQQDYYWTEQFHPLVGIEHEARGERWTAPAPDLGTPLVHYGKAETLEAQRARTEHYQRFRPAWR